MLRLAYKQLCYLYLAEVISLNASKRVKVVLVDGSFLSLFNNLGVSLWASIMGCSEFFFYVLTPSWITSLLFTTNMKPSFVKLN